MLGSVTVLMLLNRGKIYMFVGSIAPMMDLQSVVAESPWDGALVGPSFDPSQPEVVTVSVGQSAYLSCRVRQLGDRKVCNKATPSLFPAFFI